MAEDQQTIRIGEAEVPLTPQVYEILTNALQANADINAPQTIPGALVSRANFFSQLGHQYGGDRDVYQALGYPQEMTYADYLAHYKRQDIAKAVIDRPVNATWRGGITISEPESGPEIDTEFEKQWIILDEALNLISKFKRADKLTSIGRYGILLLGLNDVAGTDDFQKEASGKELLYVKPFSANSAVIKAWENDTKNPRYGLPTVYDVVMRVSDSEGSTDKKLIVHHSRVIHIIQDPLESDVLGTPALEPIFNRLLDLEKLVGGSAEMFWRGARPGYQGKIDPDFQISDDMKADLQTQIDEYEHNLRRILVNEGIDLKGLEMQVADPKPHVDVQIQMISAVKGIPKRILTGSERGELASSEDKDSWLDLIDSRRDDFAETAIVRPFVDRCVELQVLPEPKTKTYSVIWSDLFAQSEDALAKLGKTRSEALSSYSKDPIAQFVVPPPIFYKYFLGFTDDQIAELEEARTEELDREQNDFEGEED